MLTLVTFTHDNIDKYGYNRDQINCENSSGKSIVVVSVQFVDNTIYQGCNYFYL